MACLFLLAVVVQYNDPDPLRWMAVYGAACLISARVAWAGSVPRAFSLAVGAVALAWAVSIAAGGPLRSDYASMFAAWEMRSTSVEEAREASGLLIVATWMIIVAVVLRRGRPSGRPRRA
jgi:transmembrane protein TMEM220